MSVQILQGDVRTMLATLEPESVQCVVTSPPYFQLRDYGVAGQIGLEATPAEFVATLVGVFEEVRRVLRPDGVCFVNIGDSYAGSGKGPTGENGIGGAGYQERRQGFSDNSHSTSGAHGRVVNIAPKNLLLIPQRFAIAMQDAGWYVRSQIAWCKTSAMPESVKDRPTSAWESIWMFTKSARYFWDQEAVRQPHARTWDSSNGGSLGGTDLISRSQVIQGGRGNTHNNASLPNPAGANLRNYWLLGPEPSREEHYAAFVSEIPRCCILAATSEKGQCPACGSPWVRVVERERYQSTSRSNPRAEYGRSGLPLRGPSDDVARPIDDVRVQTTGWQPSCQCDAGEPVPQIVLDPFLGSGTTALVADQLGRNAVGVELSPKYTEMARRRISNDAGMFADVTVAS